MTDRYVGEEDIINYLRENPDEPVVSIYEKLKPCVLGGFPVDDIALFCDDIKCGEIIEFMDPQYRGFNWVLIWAKIRSNRAAKLNS
ncbi:MAG: hypothetical protein FWG91_12455 [Lachnospiraceae bacterium]|nr:hypothetical protein [Lachnospiraceae bacterium]